MFQIPIHFDGMKGQGNFLALIFQSFSNSHVQTFPQSSVCEKYLICEAKISQQSLYMFKLWTQNISCKSEMFEQKAHLDLLKRLLSNRSVTLCQNKTILLKTVSAIVFNI